MGMVDWNNHHLLKEEKMKIRRSITRMVFLSLTLLITTFATAEMPENAQAAVDRAKEKMEMVLVTYSVHYPDQPYWREVYEEAKHAITLAAGAPEPIGVLAEAYSRSNWHGPAFQTWQEFVAAGGAFSSEQLDLFTMSAEENAYAAYQRGELEAAADYYRAITQHDPYDAKAFRWIGRIALERGNPEEAVAAWDVVVELLPDDQGAKSFRDLARAQANWGSAAATYFFEGVRHYEANNLNQARLAFASATGENANYADAWAWLGRVNFEQRRFQDAARAYQRAANLEPNNSTYNYFLNESNKQIN